MKYSFQIACKDQVTFVEYWSSKYKYPEEEKYTKNIGRPLTATALLELFEWKNGSVISKDKTKSIQENYPLTFSGDQRERYLNHKQSGGAIWNIFYLHCLDPETWPIFDQHTSRAMRYMLTAEIVEIGTTKKQKYSAYLNEYLPFLKQFEEIDQRTLDKSLFKFGQFLKYATRYS
jgi:hypothetical protein